MHLSQEIQTERALRHSLNSHHEGLAIVDDLLNVSCFLRIEIQPGFILQHLIHRGLRALYF